MMRKLLWIGMVVLMSLTAIFIWRVRSQVKSRILDPAEQAALDQKVNLGMNADPAVDLHAFDKYEEAIGELLKDEQFDELESIADEARSQKTRFPGGYWHLQGIYAGLTKPPDKDWDDHFRKLKRWTAYKPESITPHIALADSYIAYAWEARGTGFANTVSDEHWKLFQKRMSKAGEELNAASKLPTKDPEWYAAMENLANDGDEAKRAFEEGIAYEPQYYSLYQGYANVLLPQWYGEDGDIQRFADEMMIRSGPVEGSIIYFEIAAQMTLACDCDAQLKQMSWQQIQQGYSALGDKYGLSLAKRNQFARMAVAFSDYDAARKAFEQIGDQWDPGTWRAQWYFDQAKQQVANANP